MFLVCVCMCARVVNQRMPAGHGGAILHWQAPTPELDLCPFSLYDNKK